MASDTDCGRCGSAAMMSFEPPFELHCSCGAVTLPDGTVMAEGDWRANPPDRLGGERPVSRTRLGEIRTAEILPSGTDLARSPGAPAALRPAVRWEYKHVFVEAQQLEGTGKRSLFGLGAEKMRNVYAWDDVNTALNGLGNEGWELIQFEPHWIWGNQTFGAPLWVSIVDTSRRKVEHIASYPEYIVGWYCTLRRRVSRTTGRPAGVRIRQAGRYASQVSD